MLLLTACSFKGPKDELAPIDSPRTIDAPADTTIVDGQPADAAIDAQATGSCYGHGGYRYCFDNPPTGDQTFGAGTINVDTGKTTPGNCTSIANGLCFYTFNTLILGAGSIVFKGPNPVVVIAASSMQIAGTLDATGAGAPSGAGCLAGTNPAGDGAGGGGGQGGSLRGIGGDGGKGGNSAGGTHGNSLDMPMALQSGCAGAKGGNGQMPNGGEGGRGGGGIAVVSGGSLVISGNILASGVGGGGGKHAKSGGGGGGSGGVIYLDGSSYTMSGKLFANGGGGGGGAGASDDGMPGKMSMAMDPVTNVAVGGGGGTAGGAGGVGSALGTPSMGGVTAIGGGAGGGGGGIGFVLVPQGTNTLGWKASPDPQQLP